MPNAMVQLARQIIAQAEGQPQQRYVRHPGQSTYTERQARAERLLKKEAELTQSMQNSAGLNKIAANMANPVRFRLDYKGIVRKFAIVEQIPDGVPILYDKDQPMVPAVKVGKYGTPRMIEMVGKRVEIEPFEIAIRAKVPYAELYTRRYRALDRAKDRIVEGMQLREDLIGFGLFETASGLVNTVVNNTGKFDRDLMALAFNQIERHRLAVGSLLLSTAAVSGLRRLQYQDLDQVGMQEVRETGFLGSMWGADFYVSDQIAQGSSYALTTPKYLMWIPIRKDVDVIPADDPDNLRLGFVGYAFIGMTVHNALGVEKMTFNPAV